MGLSKIELTNKIKAIINKIDGLNFIEVYENSYKFKTQIKIESILDKKPIASDDNYSYHIIIERIYKNGIELKENIPLHKVDKEEGLKILKNFIKIIEIDAKKGLEFFFEDGQNYGFNDSDGSIEIEYAIKENKEYYDIYAYYAYAGK